MVLFHYDSHVIHGCCFVVMIYSLLFMYKILVECEIHVKLSAKPGTCFNQVVQILL